MASVHPDTNNNSFSITRHFGSHQNSAFYSTEYLMPSLADANKHEHLYGYPQYCNCLTLDNSRLKWLPAYDGDSSRKFLETIPPIQHKDQLIGYPGNMERMDSKRDPGQLGISDLSLNPFQDRPGARFFRQAQDFVPMGASSSNSHNDNILDVCNYSSYGSPHELEESTVRTHPGPFSSSSVGYSSGYQSCDESASSSPNHTDSTESPELPVLSSSERVLTAESFRPVTTVPSPDPLPQLKPETTHQTTTTTTRSPATLDTGIVETAQVKKPRIKYTPEQLAILEKAFQETPYPDWDEMDELSKTLDVTEQKIKVWFQNKRARWRKKHNASQKQQKAAAILQNQQMSALYKFPASSSGFPPSSQRAGGDSLNVQLPRPHFSPQTIESKNRTGPFRTLPFAAPQSDFGPPGWNYRQLSTMPRLVSDMSQISAHMTNHMYL